MHKKEILPGTIKRHPDGFGFFIPDNQDHPDVYIPRNSMTGVMTGDKVSVEVFPERNSDRFRGEIVSVLERGTKKIVGRFFKLNDKYGILRDEGKGWGEDLKIKMEDSKGAKEKELVAAEILTYPEKNKEFTGKVVEVIGDAMDPLTDIKRVLLGSSIPQDFSKATLLEAENFGEAPDEKDFKGRVDLRDKKLITIDGATAKDFDDAVYVEMNNEGFLLYVAIADVSHYVKVGTAIDKDAYERGTSVYFPNFVVPMLPEVLSNGLCSLNPHVPRLCLVAEMQFDFTGTRSSSKFYEAVMDSKARTTYGEAQEIIDGIDNPKLDHVKENILRLADLAKLLMAKRFKEGSLDLEIPETEMVIDASGVPIDIIKSKRLFSHRLIEEMMLAANVAVATFFNEKEIPALYRIHDSPNEQAIAILEKYLFNFGSKTKLDQGKLQKRLTKALEEFTGKPEAQILNILTLRSMSQAKYHMNNVGHFGLGFEFYTHFTSPIRRYPDLIVHRLLKNLVVPNSQYRLMSEEQLATAGTVLSAAEQRSVKAERQVQSIKKARFMEKFVGQEFDGVISSVAKFGVFVLLRQYDVDGLVRIDELGHDKLEFDEENLRLVGKRSGLSFSIGDVIRIQVLSADPEAGQINFGLAGAEEMTEAEKTSKGFVKKLQDQNRPDRAAKSNEKSSNNDRPAARSNDRFARSGKPDRNDKSGRPDRSSRSNDSSARSNDRSARPNDKSARSSDKPSRSNDRPERSNDRPGAKSAGGRSQTSEGRKKDQKNSYFIPEKSAASKEAPAGKADRPERTGTMGRIQRAVEKIGRAMMPEPRKDLAPDKKLLEMILGPEEYRKATNENSSKGKPALSKKLQFAEQSKLRDNDKNSEKNSDTLKNGQPDRKDTQKRGEAQNDRRSVRKTRPAQGRGKGKAR